MVFQPAAVSENMKAEMEAALSHGVEVGRDLFVITDRRQSKAVLSPAPMLCEEPTVVLRVQSSKINTSLRSGFLLVWNEHDVDNYTI